MRSRLSRLAAPGAYLSAVVLIWLSYASYSSQFTPVGRWAAEANDPADYRFIAEYFWGVPFHPTTYDAIWHGGVQPDFTSDLWLLPKKRFALVILTNLEGGGRLGLGTLTNQIADIVL